MTTNHIQLNLDLDSDTGVKALLALARAFGDVGQAAHSMPADPSPAAVTPLRPVPPAELEESSPVKPGTAGSPAKPAVKRRRTKAQIEEDKADGVDEAFQKAAKEHPDLDVDTLRDMIRGDAEAAEAETAEEEGVGGPSDTPDQAVTTEGSEPADAFDQPAPSETEGEAPDAWKPPWIS